LCPPAWLCRPPPPCVAPGGPPPALPCWNDVENPSPDLFSMFMLRVPRALSSSFSLRQYSCAMRPIAEVESRTFMHFEVLTNTVPLAVGSRAPGCPCPAPSPASGGPGRPPAQQLPASVLGTRDGAGAHELVVAALVVVADWGPAPAAEGCRLGMPGGIRGPFDPTPRPTGMRWTLLSVDVGVNTISVVTVLSVCPFFAFQIIVIVLLSGWRSWPGYKFV